MKRVTLLVIMATCIINIKTSAQPTLQAADIFPQVNDNFKVWVRTGPDYTNLATGTNQNWSTGLPDHSTTEAFVTYSDPANTPYGSNFPAADIAEKFSTNANFEYLELPLNGPKMIGSAASATLKFVYTDFLEPYHFPLTYNSSFNDSFSGYYVSGGVTYYRKGISTTLVDGYGSFLIPAAGVGSTSSTKLVQNVLKVKTVVTYRDSASATNITNLITRETHNFYIAGVHFPVFRASKLMNGFATVNDCMYLDVNLLNTLSTFEDVSKVSVQVFPNPATGQVLLEYKSDAAGEVGISLTNVVGQEVKVLKKGVKNPELNTCHFSVSNLPKGIYFIKLAAGNTTTTKKLIVQ